MENGAEFLRNNIASIDVAMLTTVDENGNMRSQPMYTLQVEGKGIIWFFTAKISPKFDDVEENNHVNLSYSDPHSHTYISIAGTAQRVDDDERKKKFWKLMRETWFPQGVEGDNLSLLKVRIKKAEVWDSETALMKPLLDIEHGKAISAKNV